jgi:hypothetical protein
MSFRAVTVKERLFSNNDPALRQKMFDEVRAHRDRTVQIDKPASRRVRNCSRCVNQELFLDLSRSAAVQSAARVRSDFDSVITEDHDRVRYNVLQSHTGKCNHDQATTLANVSSRGAL